MKSSLVSREVTPISIELTVRGHCYDALVGLAGCDKSLPGVMMAMLRLNVPSVFMYGGSILPGRFKGRDVTRAGRLRGGRCAQCRHDERRGPARVGMRRLPVRGLVRRPVHRQHHGLRLGGDRSRFARLGRGASALRFARRLCRGLGRGGHEPPAPQHPAARHRHPQALRERGARRRRLGRVDQCGLHLPAMAHEAGSSSTSTSLPDL